MMAVIFGVSRIAIGLSLILGTFHQEEDNLHEPLIQNKRVVSKWTWMRDRLTQNHNNRRSRNVLWHRFDGFVEGATGFCPPSDWLRLLRRGSYAEVKTGYSGELPIYGATFAVRVNGLDFIINPHNAVESGSISLVNPGGKVKWTSAIYSTNVEHPMLGISGIPPRTKWLDIETASDRETVVIWGYTGTERCFFQSFSLSTGETVDWFVLDLLDDIYRRNDEAAGNEEKNR